jgi:protein TonB
VERRSPSGSLVSTAAPGHQSFRNPDATLAGDPRPVRPAPRSLNSEPTFKVSSGLMAANLISAPNPEYPALARLTHTQGEVILQAVISRDGHVSAAHVISGPHLLRGAAVDAVKRWRYRPYLADGHPVDVATIIRVDFRAHN